MVFPALGLGEFLSVPELAAQNLTQVHYRWRDDDGVEFVTIAAVQTVNGSTAGAGSFTLTSWTPGGQSANTLPALAVATRFSGVDTRGTDGSGAIEANPGIGGGDANMKTDVTTLTNRAWAFGAGTHRNRSSTVPVGETGLSINNSVGTGLNVTSLSSWYESVPAPGTVTVGASGLTEVRHRLCIPAILQK